MIWLMNRRTWFKSAALLAPSAATSDRPANICEEVSLNGEWKFTASDERQAPSAKWRSVDVPHTWQIEPATASYNGPAWYKRDLAIPAAWKGSTVRIEFESVFHSAWVYVNGEKAGEHIGKGYTAFRLDISKLLRYGAANEIEVRADNAFLDRMLPRAKSYDWTNDGGIYRPVRLLVTPSVYIDRVEIDAVLDLAKDEAGARARVVTTGGTPRLTWSVEEEQTGRTVLSGESAAGAIDLGRIPHPRRWHFDQPHLYRLRVRCGPQEIVETFGVRKFEVRDGGLYLNGERVWLAGVERMAGSHPQFGMAEPSWWIDHDHRDMKNLNCVLTRVHWMQDRRVLDFCDREGILIQLEVPTWGAATFDGMKDEPSPEILQNGLEQLREMIAQNRNHPSIFAWGLCNEVAGYNPPAKQFARAMAKEARRLDPGRLLSYASNTLHSNTAEDVAGEMDILEWNEYYESWYGGTPENVRESLRKIRSTYPSKPIIISEYGLCECSPRNPAGDDRRAQVLQSHNAVYREEPNVAGLIFFCYNDYRTHIGDKGLGALKQRVHGVVDVYGNRKPSYDALRAESSPIEKLELRREAAAVIATVTARKTQPAHTMRGYLLRITAYGYAGLPMEQQEQALPDMNPGAVQTVHFNLNSKDIVRIGAEVVRPTGYSVLGASLG